jgi:hypothetical protein
LSSRRHNRKSSVPTASQSSRRRKRRSSRRRRALQRRPLQRRHTPHHRHRPVHSRPHGRQPRRRHRPRPRILLLHRRHHRLRIRRLRRRHPHPPRRSSQLRRRPRPPHQGSRLRRRQAIRRLRRSNRMCRPRSSRGSSPRGRRLAPAPAIRCPVRLRLRSPGRCAPMPHQPLRLPRRRLHREQVRHRRAVLEQPLPCHRLPRARPCPRRARELRRRHPAIRLPSHRQELRPRWYVARRHR